MAVAGGVPLLAAALILAVAGAWWVGIWEPPVGRDSVRGWSI